MSDLGKIDHTTAARRRPDANTPGTNEQSGTNPSVPAAQRSASSPFKRLTSFWGASLKIRMAAYMMLAFLAASIAVAVLASHRIQRDMREQIERQQHSLASMIARGLSSQFDERIATLTQLAQQAATITPDGSRALRSWLDGQVAVASSFNRGVFVTDASGVAVASWPQSAGRLGLNYGERDYMVAALREGRTAVGRPVLGRPLGKPVLLIAVPVRGSRGEILGAVVGVTDLGRPSFLDGLLETEVPNAMQYHLVDGQHRLFVASTDRTRAMEKLPDGNMLGGWGALLVTGGASTVLSDKGISTYATSRPIQSVNWHLVLTVPASQVLEPVRNAQGHVLQAIGGLMLLGTLLVLWVLQRELKPLQMATMALRSQSSGEEAATRPLPVTQPDEIGALIQAFNGLLHRVAEREGLLRISDSALQSISQGVLITGADQRIQSANPSFAHITGYSFDEISGRNCSFLQGPDTRKETVQEIRAALANEKTFSGEILNYRKDGQPFWNELTISPVLDAEGRLTHFVGVTRDITARRRADELLRISAAAFESQEGIFVTDVNMNILRVNQSFTRITGYSEEEAVGRTPKLLSSGRHDSTFYASMWEAINRDGTWQGEIWNRRKNGELFPESITITAVSGAGSEITHYVANFIDVGDRKSAEAAINTLAFYDPLTRLPNRRLLSDRLQHALLKSARQYRQGALLFIDLDNFKSLNDTRGHHMGDALLEMVAHRLGSAVRDDDTVARLGGDEFVVLIEGLDIDPLIATREADKVGTKLIESFQTPFVLDGTDFHCTASIGVTLFGNRIEAVDEPLKRADMAMYEAKSAGRNTLRHFDPGIQAAISARVSLEDRLRRAVGGPEFHLCFQPLVAEDARVVGAEALLRWVDQVSGPISPAEFIPLAEESGLILKLGRWVLDDACRTLAAWAESPALSQLTLSVNVSVRQFQHISFVDDVRNALQRHGADPSRLKLEITESVVVNRLEEVISKMNALRSDGVRFSLDDFGTGYSSLSYLKRLPIEELKVDRSFVRDVLVDSNDAAIAEMVLAMARTLKLQVVAEGVETEAQWRFLQTKGCQYFQGYLFSHPLKHQEFLSWVLGNRKAMPGSLGSWMP